MDKIDKFYEEYGKEVILSTGEVIEVDKFVDMVNSIKKDDAKVRKKKGLEKKLEIESALNYYELKKDESFYGRRFIMLYQKSLRKLNLSYQSLGVLTIFTEYIREDGSCSLYGETTKKYWTEILNMTPKTLEKICKELEGNKVIAFVKNRGFFLNPYYIRYGNRINKEVFEIFDNIKLVDGVIKLKNNEQETE